MKYLLITLGFVVCVMIIRWYRVYRLKRKWAIASSVAFSEEDRRFLGSNFKAYTFLNPEERDRLELKMKYFLRFKKIVAAQNLSLTHEMELLIAAEACLLVINLDGRDLYPGLSHIYILSDAYVESNNPVNPSTGLPYFSARFGESWKRGPIMLSWEEVQESSRPSLNRHNLIVHEFSHHLDQQDDHFDGTPKLRHKSQYQKWAMVMGREFQALKLRISQFKKSDIDIYAGTNEAEFFAVCTEYFFSDPYHLEQNHPEIFELFLDYFRIDPRRWA